MQEESKNYEKENFIDDNFNINEDLHNGQIYLIKNKINNKCYIGQALCFTGKNNNKWGALGRWKSHIRETLGEKDNCCILNGSIRKYGVDNFEVLVLIKCPIEELNEKEVYFINLYNSLVPNGYNVKTGGDSGKDSDETKIKKSLARLGTRRDKYSRKYEEDKDLPKYIRSMRIKSNDNTTILDGYVVNKFPIGVDKKEYVKDKYFYINKSRNGEESLKEAIEYLDQLKLKYNYINEEVFPEKSEIKPILTFIEKKENNLIDKLPENIFPILEDFKIKGYTVKDIKNNNDYFYPEKDFIGKTNRWNLNDAKKYKEQLLYYKSNNIDITNFGEIDVSGKNNKILDDKFYLPKYVNIYRKKGIEVGFVINGYPDSSYQCGKLKKEFADRKLSKEENYQNCIKFLEELKITKPIQKSIII